MELLIRVIDRPGLRATKRQRAQASHKGDVIVSRPSGHPWSLRERKNRHWRILRVPRLLSVESDALVEAELDVAGVKPYVRRRRRRINLDRTVRPSAELEAYLADNSRAKIKFRLSSEDHDWLMASVLTRPDATDGD